MRKHGKYLSEEELKVKSFKKLHFKSYQAGESVSSRLFQKF